MPIPSHIEHHFTASDTVRDIVIGMSDGLTVPFALAVRLVLCTWTVWELFRLGHPTLS